MDRTVIKMVAEWLPYLLEVRKRLHEVPEVGLQEFKTADIIRRVLSEQGISFSPCYETGTVALQRGQNSGPTIAVRAEIDALPIQERNDVSFRSQNEGVMHACGHDVHSTIVLGTAIVMKHLHFPLNGNVKYLFQPAEENAGGAQKMIEHGALENPKVDRILGMHVWPKLGRNSFAVCDGPAMAGFNTVRIKLKGKGGHIAFPAMARNPIYAGAALVQAMQTIRTQTIDPKESVVFDVGAIHAGGKVSNAIPEELFLAASVRTYSEQVGKKIESELQDLLEGYQRAYHLGYELEYKYGYKPVCNDERAAKDFRNAAAKVAGIEIVPGERDFGAEDFGYYLSEAEGAMAFLGVGQEADYPLHSPYFLPDEDAIRRGILIYCQAILDFLTEAGGSHYE